MTAPVTTNTAEIEVCMEKKIHYKSVDENKVEFEFTIITNGNVSNGKFIAQKEEILTYRQTLSH